MAKIISITNQKGGVGKTTTSINLSAALGEKGKRILLVDFDPQANATSGMGIDVTDDDKTIMDVIKDNTLIDKAIFKNVKNNVDVLIGDVVLSSLESELVNVENKETELKRVLEKVGDNYDFIIIDCPPAVGILTVNALVASNACIIPLQCEYFSLEGLKQVMSVIDLVRTGMNKDLKIDGILFTMYDSRTTLSKDVVKGVKDSIDENIFETMIPRNVRLAEAPSNGMSIMEYESNSVGADRYRKLADEVINRA